MPVPASQEAPLDLGGGGDNVSAPQTTQLDETISMAVPETQDQEEPMDLSMGRNRSSINV